MPDFIFIISTFPTAIYTVLLVVVIFYWLVSSLGLIDLDGLVGDVNLPDGVDGLDGADGALDGLDGAESAGEGAVAGLLFKLGLHGVPLSFVITLVVLLGWIVSYFAMGALYNNLIISGIFRWLAGAGVFILSLGIAIFFTSRMMRPVRKFITRQQQQAQVSARFLVGEVVVIRSGVADHERGEARHSEGASDLILQVRCEEGASFKKGDRAVILQYNPGDHTYQIVSEDEFAGRV